MKQLSLPRRADPVKKRPPCGVGANVEPPKRLRLKSREPGELYCSDIVYPSGISNPFSNCYANSILQCMMNHSSFSEITGGSGVAKVGPCRAQALPSLLGALPT